MPESFYVHALESDFQSGKTPVWVLPPLRVGQARRYRTLYVLPAHPGPPDRLLDILLEMRVSERYGVFTVVPAMSAMPWYGDHPENLKVRQESYLVRHLLPFVEDHYPVISGPEGRLLLGFSKSGWGAFSLIMRNPQVFGSAAAWDAPMFADHLFFGMDEVFGTPAYMMQYLPSALVIQQAAYFKDKTRLVLAGENLWGQLEPSPGGASHTREMADLIHACGARLQYNNSLNAGHVWSPDWMEPVLTCLMEL